MPKKLLGLVSLFILAVGLLVSLNLASQKQELRKKASANGSILSIEPASLSVNIGDTFSLAVMINTQSDTVSSAELHLTYDPAIIQGLTITSGSLLPTAVVRGRIGGGTADIVLGSDIIFDKDGNQVPNPPPPGSIGPLVTLTFTALNPSASTAINFADTTYIAAIGSDENSLASKSGANITINTVANPSQTPTPSLTGTPSATPIPTITLIPSNTPVPTLTATPIPSRTPTPSATPIPSNTPVPTPTVGPASPTASPPVTPSPTMPNYPTLTPTVIPSATPVLTVNPTNPSCTRKNQGDANCDGTETVDGIDYSLWLNSQCHASPGQICGDISADFNNDGNVDDLDYDIWLLHREP